MRKVVLFLLLFGLLLAGPAVVRYLRYYELTPEQRPTPAPYDPATVQDVPTPVSSDFRDKPVTGQGLVLLDVAHRNNFVMDDIAYLDGRLAARGVEMLSYDGGDLSLALRSVNAFIVITPLDAFTPEEVLAVSRFVAGGGRLLLIGDPTRFNVIFDEEDLLATDFEIETDQIPLNSLANEFDISFNGDYLYNTVENEGNFRNIILRDEGFAAHELLGDLQQLVFYSAHSLQVGPSGDALITADDNTWSSATDRPGDLMLAVAGREGKVLALGDIHFLTQPYFTVFDNSQFIAHIADFLAQAADRRLTLADFPYFYRGPVSLVYAGAPDLGPDAFDEIIALQDAFRRVDRQLSLAAEPPEDADALILGLYNQADDLVDLLELSGISLLIDPPILVDAGEPEATETAVGDGEGEETAVRLIQSSLGSVQMAGSTLILFDEDDAQRHVIVLAASGQGLENSVDRLLDLIPFDADHALSDCLLQDNLAVCPSNVLDEAVEAELDSRGPADALAAEEEPAPEGEEEDEGGDGSGGVGGGVGAEAVLQGTISIGETITDTLAEGEAHAWHFNEGPTTIDITLSGEEIDGVLILLDPDGEPILTADK